MSATDPTARAEAVDKVARVIHVTIYDEATEEECDRLMDRVAVAAYDMERGPWDPMVFSHTQDCHLSDHCALHPDDAPDVIAALIASGAGPVMLAALTDAGLLKPQWKWDKETFDQGRKRLVTPWEPLP
jgi:hypothetical protein